MERDTERMQETVQRSWNYNVKFDFNKDKIKKIAKACGSATLKKTFDYIFFLQYHCGNNFYGLTVDETAFLYGSFEKRHFRLAEIAVEEENQHKGYGSFMMSILFEECAKRGIHEITLRTSKSENAHLWYRKLGAEYVGIKDNDYEMRFII